MIEHTENRKGNWCVPVHEAADADGTGRLLASWQDTMGLLGNGQMDRSHAVLLGLAVAHQVGHCRTELQAQQQHHHILQWLLQPGMPEG